MSMKSVLAMVAASLLLTGCGQTEQIYTLYRSYSMNPNTRTHIATFDANDGRDYNNQNCLATQYLYQQKAGSDAKYWCEYGPYRKN